MLDAVVHDDGLVVLPCWVSAPISRLRSRLRSKRDPGAGDEDDEHHGSWLRRPRLNPYLIMALNLILGLS